MSAPSHSRREALRLAAIGAGAVAAGGLAQPALAAGQAPDDEDLRDFLVEAIALEQVTVLAYATATDLSDVSAEQQGAYELFRDQEQAHANALRTAIESLGFDAPDAPGSTTDSAVVDDVDGLSAEAAEAFKKRLSELDRAAEEPKALLDLLLELEREQLRFYSDNAPALDSVDLARTGAEIAGCQAQHLVVLGPISKGAAAKLPNGADGE